ncbi:hypothetical protein D3C85_814790 [compost metagenome]
MTDLIVHQSRGQPLGSFVDVIFSLRLHANPYPRLNFFGSSTVIPSRDSAD